MWKSAIQNDQDLNADIKSSLSQFFDSVHTQIHYAIGNATQIHAEEQAAF